MYIFYIDTSLCPQHSLSSPFFHLSTSADPLQQPGRLWSWTSRSTHADALRKDLRHRRSTRGSGGPWDGGEGRWSELRDLNCL